MYSSEPTLLCTMCGSCFVFNIQDKYKFILSYTISAAILLVEGQLNRGVNYNRRLLLGVKDRYAIY
jgi:uncharacterized cysteine cluster protein YcgN (CxxCxxCC family)